MLLIQDSGAVRSEPEASRIDPTSIFLYTSMFYFLASSVVPAAPPDR